MLCTNEMFPSSRGAAERRSAVVVCPCALVRSSLGLGVGFLLWLVCVCLFLLR